VKPNAPLGPTVGVADPPVAGPARTLRLGTRASARALAQSGMIADRIRDLGGEVELVTIRTLGDVRPPDTTWGEGAFVGALETALLDGSVDLAVHSAKDVPTTEDPRLVIAAYPIREDPRDALVCREAGLTLERLPAGSRIGTDSPRRSAFLRSRRPDLRVHPLHGNVDTRLRRLDEGQTDALILAVAGLSRLGLKDRISEILPADIVPPAPGQGSLAVQCRTDDAATRGWLAHLDDPATRAAVEMERAFLRASGGGCRAPIGALARIERGEIVLVGGSAGIEAAQAQAETDETPTVAWGVERGPIEDRIAIAAWLAARLSAELDERGGRREGTARSRRILVTRTRDQARQLVAALEAAGLEPVAIPTIELEAVAPGGPLDAAIAALSSYRWIVITSANGAEAAVAAARRTGTDPAGARWAAVGSATAEALSAAGIAAALTPSRASGERIAAELPIESGDRVLLARADIADGRLPAALRARGAVVDDVVAYRTLEAPAASREPLRQAIDEGPFGAIVFTSGSTVRGLLALLEPAGRRIALRSLACCIGSSTGQAARDAGFGRVVEAPMQTAAAIAELVAARLVRSPDGPADPSFDPTSDPTARAFGATTEAVR
jgi:hydroxymethylbilane synthase